MPVALSGASATGQLLGAAEAAGGGLQLLPGVPQHVRDVAIALPKPTMSGSRRKRGEPAPEVEYDLSDRLTRAVEKLLKGFR